MIASTSVAFTPTFAQYVHTLTIYSHWRKSEDSVGSTVLRYYNNLIFHVGFCWVNTHDYLCGRARRPRAARGTWRPWGRRGWRPATRTCSRSTRPSAAWGSCTWWPGTDQTSCSQTPARNEMMFSRCSTRDKHEDHILRSGHYCVVRWSNTSDQPKSHRKYIPCTTKSHSPTYVHTPPHIRTLTRLCTV